MHQMCQVAVLDLKGKVRRLVGPGFAGLLTPSLSVLDSEVLQG